MYPALQPDIRPAKPEEAAKLEAFLAMNAGQEHRSLAREYVRSSFSGAFHRPAFLVAIENRGIIGSAAYSREFFTFSTWGISWVNVHPERRNRGLGRALVQACLDAIALTADGDATAILGTLPGKSALYDQLGFQKNGTDHQGGWYMTRIIGKS
jgi:predicted N-acetyltransferase YhbS